MKGQIACNSSLTGLPLLSTKMKNTNLKYRLFSLLVACSLASYLFLSAQEVYVVENTPLSTQVVSSSSNQLAETSSDALSRAFGTLQRWIAH